MYVALIPFFLAANVSVDNSERWTHGAEFTFLGDFRFHIHSKLDEDFSTYLQYSLKCRNKDPRTNFCQISNAVVNDTSKYDVEEYETMRDELTSTPFEINFNENGVESLTFPGGTSTTIVVLQFLASLFNIGTDLKQRTTSPQFTATYEGVLGECSTDYNIDVQPVDESSEETPYRKNNYDLLVIPYANLKSNMKFEIKKIRDLDSCTFFTQYDNQVTENRPRRLTIYNSKIVITNRGLFKTSSILQSKTRWTPKSRQYSDVNTRTFGLQLVSIEEANRPLVPIAHPKTIDVSMSAE